MSLEATASPIPPDHNAGVFVVVPAFNEGPALETVLASLRAVYPNVIVVDDGSSDQTAEVGRRSGARVLRHVINRGQGAALQTGFDFALQCGARVVVTFDADGQHLVEDIEGLIAPILSGGCDIVLGSRFLAGGSDIPTSRQTLLRLATWFTRATSGMAVTDAHNGLRAFSCRALGKIDIHLDRMAHASELMDQIRASGLPWREVPVSVRYTSYSMAKGQSARGALKILTHYLLGKVVP